MKVLVTGGAGFIGSHLTDQLVADGHDVLVLDDLSTGSLQNVNADAAFVRMNILDPGLAQIFAREKFDAVFHLAAQTIVGSSLEHPDIDAKVNVSGTLQVLEGCRRSGVGRVIFASSAAVYGDTPLLPVPEDAPKQPASFYGLSKLTAERYIQLYHELFGLQYMILRYANVFGERQGDRGEGGVVSIFTRAMQRGESLTVFGDGTQTRDFIYVGDVAAANIRAARAAEANRVLNVGTQSETSVNQLAGLLSDVAGRPASTVYREERPGDILKSMLRNSEARQILDWSPATSLREGLGRTYRALVG